MILKDENFLHALLESNVHKVSDGTSNKLAHVRLSDELCKLLLPELEEKTMHLIQEAKKIMRHSKRKVLKANDVEAALKIIEHGNWNQVFGNVNSRDCHFNVGSMLYKDNFYPWEYEKKVNADSNKWVHKNEDINLLQFISKPITETPLKTSIQMHWALLNGEVPLVPENILPPKKKTVQKNKEPDPFIVLLKPQEEIAPKKKINMEHITEIPITKEVMEFWNKFFEMFNIEEHDNKTSYEMRTSNEISSDFSAYISMLQNEPSVASIIPAVVDFIYNKWVDYISTKIEGDSKMLFIWIKIIHCLLSNEYYNCEEKIHLFIDLLYDTLIRDDYNKESIDEWGNKLKKRYTQLKFHNILTDK